MSVKITFHGPYEFTPVRGAVQPELDITDHDGNRLTLYLQDRDQAEALSRAALVTLGWLNGDDEDDWDDTARSAR